MTFKDISTGDIFEYREQAARRVGVKISDKEAWLFQEKRTATLAHNRTVDFPVISGRLMRDRDGRACVVNQLGNSSTVAGFSVIPLAFVEGQRADFTVISGNSRELHDEVDIIMKKISQSIQKTATLLAALEVILSDF